MCKCIERLDERLAEFNTRIALPWFGPQLPMIETLKADERKRIRPRKIFASFCPFCGEEYSQEAKQSPLSDDRDPANEQEVVR